MVRKGFVEQQIELLGALLQRILGLKVADDYDGARIALLASAKAMTGMEMEMLLALPEGTLTGLFTTRGKTDAGRMLSGAVLLDEWARLSERAGDTQANLATLRKALLLYALALRQEKILRQPTWQNRLQPIEVQLRAANVPLSSTTLYALADCYEAIGQFGHAEDTLFLLRERKGEESRSRMHAIAFYNNLLRLPDDALTAGGLARDEVEEALADLQSES